MRIRFIPLIFIYYSSTYKYVYTYICVFNFFFLQVVFSFSYIIIISVSIYPLSDGKEGMRKTFSLAFAKRRAELRFVIYDLMCCLQKTHSLNSISLRAAISYLFFQSNSPNLYYYYHHQCGYSYYHHRHRVVAYPDS